MKLDRETPSAMVQQYYSLPLDDYNLDLWQHLMAGVLIGAGLVLIVALILASFHQVQS